MKLSQEADAKIGQSRAKDVEPCEGGYTRDGGHRRVGDKARIEIQLGQLCEPRERSDLVVTDPDVEEVE